MTLHAAPPQSKIPKVLTQGPKPNRPRLGNPTFTSEGGGGVQKSFSRTDPLWENPGLHGSLTGDK